MAKEQVEEGPSSKDSQVGVGRRYPKNSAKTFSLRPIWLYGSIWDASSWATEDGKHKADYRYQPFLARYTNFKAILIRTDEEISRKFLALFCQDPHRKKAEEEPLSPPKANMPLLVYEYDEIPLQITSYIPDYMHVASEEYRALMQTPFKCFML
ncbi:hypothetical protein Fmac_008528 [Flemingia macrophylla]|uniref:GH16 domain-containing protein n=1 Tax=Flemingia macrophylla TaxID=520843 RepID=A0ABD1MXN6_9FABA